MEITSLDALTEPEQKARRYLQQLAPHVSSREGAEIIRELLTVVDNLRFNVHKVIQQRTRWDKVATMEKEANALLIAENRRLREALELVVKWADDNGRKFKLSVDSDSGVAKAIRNALAKHGANHEQG